jgi:hypothetical protein
MSAQESFDHVAADLTARGAVTASMFGKQGLKVGKTAFGCLVGDGLALKLGAGTSAHDGALALPGAALFDPSGRDRPFKDWVVVPHAAVKEWGALARDALARAGPG